MQVSSPLRGYSPMLLAQRFAAAATAFLLIAGGFFVLFFSMAESSRAAAASDSCASPAGITVLPSPRAPWTGAPLRVMVVAEKPVEGTLSLIAPDGSVAVKPSDRRGRAPYFRVPPVPTPAPRPLPPKLGRDPPTAGCAPQTPHHSVTARQPGPVRRPAGSDAQW